MKLITQFFLFIALVVLAFGSECPESSTCTNGCCPFHSGVCCDDGKHCCPSGFKCDPSGTEKCVSADEYIKFPVTRKALKVLLYVKRFIYKIDFFIFLFIFLCMSNIQRHLNYLEHEHGESAWCVPLICV